jgi:hypothetical protein
MPATTKRARGNVGKIGDELAKRNLPTKPKGYLGQSKLFPSMSRKEETHYKAYRCGAITLNSAITECPSLAKLLNENEKC